MILLGTGDGIFGRINSLNNNVLKQEAFIHLDGRINGISINNKFTEILCGTSEGNLYELELNKLSYSLKVTAHSDTVYSVAFPSGCNEIFATASVGEIRLWNIKNHRELLRIKVPTQICKSILISHDGRSIISGWSDGKIRAFYPESGKLLYVIHDVHKGDVTVRNEITT